MNFKCKVLCVVFIIKLNLFSIDNVHFYQPNFFWGEPRYAVNWLVSCDLSTYLGRAFSAFDSKGRETPLLNLYGLHNMHKLGKNIKKDLNDRLDLILHNLEQVPGRENFGQLKFLGSFNITEIVFDFYQNFTNGFFIQFHCPIKKLRISNIRYKDMSPNDIIYPNKNIPEWQAFLSSFDKILNKYSINMSDVLISGFGNISWLIGWSKNYQDTTYLDFFDMSIKAGILFPTDKLNDPDTVFSLSTGYGKHYGVPCKCDFSIGVYDWLTFGFHIGALFLFKNYKTMRMKTDFEQNGFIKLSKGRVKFDLGNLLDISLYMYADHFIGGLSLLFAYSYNRKDKAYIDLKNQGGFKSEIVNSDSILSSWNSNVFNFSLEYDFSEQNCRYGIKAGLSLNYTLNGKRIFKTNMTGLLFGLNFLLDY